MSNFVCVNCNNSFDTDSKESYHQVNDNNENTYCSYECSAVGTLEYILSLNSDLTFDEIKEIIEST